ncbi:MAG: hydrolase [Clostridiales bacterium]|nr:hydrolase [Clostridiales bacterium]
MSYIPDEAKCFEIFAGYNEQGFHYRHAEIVSGIMKYFAKEFDPGKEDFWAAVGFLHDLAFEKYPEEQPVKQVEIMRELGLAEELIQASIVHCWDQVPGADLQPETTMEKILYAADDLSSLIFAANMLRDSRSVDDMETWELDERFDTPTFAPACSRKVILKGAEMLGWTRDEIFQRVIDAMRSMNPDAGL